MMNITLEQFGFRFFQQKINLFDHLQVEFQAGKFYLITGFSGCGKSTLLHLIAGVYHPQNSDIYSGKIMLGSRDIRAYSVVDRTCKIAMMFQNPDMQFTMDTVENELIFCLENIGVPVEQIDRKIRQALDFADLMKYATRRLSTLSGGEKQRVALACIFAIDPEWILLDEPFANLDDESTVQILKKLALLRAKREIGIIAVDHRLHYYNDIDHVYSLQKNGLFSIRRDDFQILKERAYPSVSRACKERENVLWMSRVKLNIDGISLLQIHDLKVQAGKIYMLLGRSGCGKTSLIDAIFGLRKYSGMIQYHGKNIEKVRFKNGYQIGYVTQNPTDQFLSKTVYEEVDSCIENDTHDQTEKVLRAIGLWKYRDVSPYMLSQGQQRKLAVSSLMNYQCDLLLCDEPTYAQDFENTLVIMNQLYIKSRQQNTAVIMSTHDTQLAYAYGDVIWKMEGGYVDQTDQSGD